MICSLLHVSVFGDYVTTARCDQCNIMCSIEAHEREHKYINDEVSIRGGRPLPYNSTKYVLILFGLTLKFIYICLK